MPSLISRFFGKKKSTESSNLLDGEKYEAVEKPSSPSAQTFATERPKSPAKEGKGLGIRRKPVPSLAGVHKRDEPAPTLSLTLPDTKLEEKKSQGVGIGFEDIANNPPLLDKDLLSRMLTPAEALCLIQKTAKSISERGVETLGVMRPHWFASLPHQDTQQKLISRYIQVLSAQQANGAASTSTTSPLAAFESELRYIKDQHDVAAVLRWGLRHLELQGHCLGTTKDWYKSFTESEQAASCPPKAFDEILTPLLPEIHTELIRVLLDLISSLAAHSEQNGISGNKLSKVLAWWVVSSRSTTDMAWPNFYKQWEAAARQFEHMFLAFIRAQEVQSRMPRRLTELVKHYPFSKNRREDDGIFLPQPRFSTRRTPALFLRVTVDKEGSTVHPLRIVEEAFKATADGPIDGELATLWQNIRHKAYNPIEEMKTKAEASQFQPSLNLSLILADESIRLFALVPGSYSLDNPLTSLLPSLSVNNLPRSFFKPDRPQSTISATATSEKLAASPVTTPGELDIVTDWQAFSSAGFRSPSGLSLAASLWDNDTEVTRPPSPKKNNGVGKRNLSILSGRTSTDAPSPTMATVILASSSEPKPTPGIQDPEPTKIVYSSPELIQLDEAFIDFWADTLLDTAVIRSWPTFVLCQLKHLDGVFWPKSESEKQIEWLIIERVITKTPPSPVLEISEPPSPVQPKKTATGNKGFKWSLTPSSKKRRSIFGSSSKVSSENASTSSSVSGKKKAPIGLKADEMGKILKEESEEEAKPKKEAKANGVGKTDDQKPETPIAQVNGNNPSLSAKPEKERAVPEEPTSPVGRKSQEMAAVAAAAGGPEVLAGIVEHDEKTQAPEVEVETTSTPAFTSAVEHTETIVTGPNVPVGLAGHAEGERGKTEPKTEKAELASALTPVLAVDNTSAGALGPEGLVEITEHDERGEETKAKQVGPAPTPSPSLVPEHRTVQDVEDVGEEKAEETQPVPVLSPAPVDPAAPTEPDVLAGTEEDAEGEKGDRTADDVGTASTSATEPKIVNSKSEGPEHRNIEDVGEKRAEESQPPPALSPAPVDPAAFAELEALAGTERDAEGEKGSRTADEIRTASTFAIMEPNVVNPESEGLEHRIIEDVGEKKAEETRPAPALSPAPVHSAAVVDPEVLAGTKEGAEGETASAFATTELRIVDPESEGAEAKIRGGELTAPPASVLEYGAVQHAEDGREPKTGKIEAGPATAPPSAVKPLKHDGEGGEAKAEETEQTPALAPAVEPVGVANAGPQNFAGIAEHEGDTKIEIEEAEPIPTLEYIPTTEPTEIAVTGPEALAGIAEHAEGGRGETKAEEVERAFALTPTPTVEPTKVVTGRAEVLAGTVELDKTEGDYTTVDETGLTPAPVPVQPIVVNDAEGEGEATVAEENEPPIPPTVEHEVLVGPDISIGTLEHNDNEEETKAKEAGPGPEIASEPVEHRTADHVRGEGLQETQAEEAELSSVPTEIKQVS